MIEHLPIAISQAVHVNHALILGTYALRVVGGSVAGDLNAASAIAPLTRQNCTEAVQELYMCLAC